MFLACPRICSWCGLLLVILILFFITPISDFGPPHVQTEEIKNSHYLPLDRDLVTVIITNQGRVWVSGNILEESSRSLWHEAIEDSLVERNQLEAKVLLKADINLQFGKVADVLKIIREAGIENVGLVTKGFAPPTFHFLE